MKDLKDLTVSDVRSVYSGKKGKCCCGCSGTYYYNSSYQEEESKRRGYPIDDEEVSDKMVNKVLRKLQTDGENTVKGGNNYSMVIGQRLYIVYPI